MLLSSSSADFTDSMRVSIEPVGVIRSGFEGSDILIYPEFQSYLSELIPNETILIVLMGETGFHKLNIVRTNMVNIKGNFIRLDTTIEENALVLDIYREKELIKG